MIGQGKSGENEIRVEMPMRINFGKPRLTPRQAVSSFAVSCEVDGLTAKEREEIARGLSDAALNLPESVTAPVGEEFSEEARDAIALYMIGYEYGMTLDLVMRSIDVIARAFPDVDEAEKLNIARTLSSQLRNEVNRRLREKRSGEESQ